MVLRALVIGGLAGAAWLLSGTAAHAADPVPATGGTSPAGAVVDGDQPSRPALGRVCRAVPPVESLRHRGQGCASTRPGPVTTPDSGDPGQFVRERTAPTRLTGEAAVPRRHHPLAGPPELDRPVRQARTQTTGPVAAVADAGAMATGRPGEGRATETGFRRHDAEAPTVSPD